MTRRRKCRGEVSAADKARAQEQLSAAEMVLIESMTKLMIVMESMRISFYEYLDQTFAPINQAAVQVRETLRERLKETGETLRSIQQQLQITLSRQLMTTSQSVERITNQVKTLERAGSVHGFPETIFVPYETPGEETKESQSGSRIADIGTTATESSGKRQSIQDSRGQDLHLPSMRGLAEETRRGDERILQGTTAAESQSETPDAADLALMERTRQILSGSIERTVSDCYDVPDDLTLAIPYLHFLRIGKNHAEAVAAVAELQQMPMRDWVPVVFGGKSTLNDRKDGE